MLPLLFSVSTAVDATLVGDTPGVEAMAPPSIAQSRPCTEANRTPVAGNHGLRPRRPLTWIGAPGGCGGGPALEG